MPKKSSHRWLQEHFNDPYVKQAHKEGYRSRAVYKLLELHQRDHLFRSGMTVIDLGSSPGSWSQVLSNILTDKGKILAVDILPMEPLPNVEFLLGDFSDDAFYEKLLTQLNGVTVDWVISDMSPNKSGISSVDQPRAIYLCELALEFALKVLNNKGGFLIKAFQGEGFEPFLKSVKTAFTSVNIRKPKASRDRSNEVYLLAKGRR